MPDYRVRHLLAAASAAALLSIGLAVPDAQGVDLSTPTSARLRPKQPGTWAATKDTIRFLIDAFYFAEAESLTALRLEHMTRSSPVSPPRLIEPMLLLAEARLYRTDSTRAQGVDILDGLQRDSSAIGLTPAQSAKIAMLRGVAFHNAADFASARSQIVQAMEVTERAVGKEHPDYATCRAWRGRHLRGYDTAAQAESLYAESARFFEEYEGSDSDSLFDCLEYQASNSFFKEGYSRALRIFDRVVEQQTRSLGAGAPRLALTYYRLSWIYGDLARWEEARDVAERGVSILEARPVASAKGAALWTALAVCYEQLQDWERAERTYRRSVELDRIAYPGLPLLGWHARTNRCSALLQLGRIAEGRDEIAALRAIGQAPGWREATNLEYWRAVLALAAGDLTDARAALDSAYSAIELHGAASGIADFDYVIQADGLYHWLCGDTRPAFDLALRTEETARERLQSIAEQLSDAQALTTEAARTEGMGLALSALAADPSHAESRRAALDAVVRSRAMVLDVVATRRQRWARSPDENVSALAESLRAVRTTSSRLAVAARGAALSAAQREAVAKEHVWLDSLWSVDPYRARWRARESVGFTEFSAAIPRSSVVVSYVRFDRRGEATGSGKDSRVTSPWYAAFVCRSEAGDPAFHDIGSAVEIDSLIRGWRDGVVAEVNGMSRSRSRQFGNELRRLVWDRLAIDPRELKTLFIVADGALGGVSFASLPASGGSQLLSHLPPISYLSAERDLVPIAHDGGGVGLLALGAPDFSNAPAAPRAGFTALASNTSEKLEESADAAFASHYRGQPSACEDIERMMFGELRHTEAEAKATVDLCEQRGMPALALIGAEASEDAFKRLAPGRTVVHVASHGFYLPSRCATSGSLRESALLRTGIAFAGANLRATRGEEAEDGILTGEEVSTLDLSGTDCVVLSACETGAGDIVNGEGVIGLRRAFQVAGARSLVTALWKVDDAATRTWMREFYLGLLERNQDPATAAHAASRKMYEWSKRAGRGDDVSTWGAFVVSGVGRPLRPTESPASSRQ